jgi:signal-transduction protein with cAMP-binding, CBS, and nucleotidyltransferase domain
MRKSFWRAGRTSGGIGRPENRASAALVHDGVIAVIASPRQRDSSRCPEQEGTMFVSDILSRKGSSVFSVQCRTSVAEIARNMSELRIGSALVLQADNGIAGIVSERDLVRALARHGAAAMDLEAQNVMTADVTTCDPDDSIDHDMETMTHGRFRH